MNLQIVRDDITNMGTDAIVLPANSRLREGSGASAAIYQRAGRKDLERACARYGRIDVGMAVPTPGFHLKAACIIHAVVPKWVDGRHNEYGLLSAAYFSALSVADDLGCKSIAFPLLASGNNGFDLELAYQIANDSINKYKPVKELEQVILVVYGHKVSDILRGMGVTVREGEHSLNISNNKDFHFFDRKVQTRNHENQEGSKGDWKNASNQFLDMCVKKTQEFLADDRNKERIIQLGIAIAEKAIRAKWGNGIGDAASNLLRNRK